MRKLIEIQQEYDVVCDNKSCDYKIVNEDKNVYDKDPSRYLNTPCPKCGDNLLTEKDLATYIKTVRIVKFINKWFSWITIFYGKNRKNTDTTTLHTHFHDGIHITRSDDSNKKS